MGEIYLYRLDFARVIPIYWYFGKRNPKKTNKILNYASFLLPLQREF
jgi:hypothetical protein